MRKLIFLSTGMILMMFLISVSCKKETNPQDDPPSIKLQSGAGYISANSTVKINDSIKFGIRATPNSNTGAKITTLNFERNFNGQKYNNSYNLTNNNVDLSTKANSQVGNETFTMTITDEKGATASVQVVVTTITPTIKESISGNPPASEQREIPVSIKDFR
jgi:hypothetical protein